MRTPNLRRIFIIAGIVSLLASYLGVWIRLIKDPVQRTGSDFIAFYSAGRVAQDEGMAKVYNPILQQQIQQREVGFPLVQGQVLLYNHLPFLIPVLRVIVSTDYVGSFYRWVAILIAIYIVGIASLTQGLKQVGLDRNSTLLTAIGGFLFLPVFFSLLNGQDTAFLFLGTSIWVYGLLSGKETLAGLGLSLTTVRPHIALFLAVPMLFRSIKVFTGFLIGSGILALLSILILGISGTREFIDIIFLSASGEWYGIKENVMYNLIGLLTRITPQLNAEIIRTIGWVIYVMTIIGLSIFWFRTQDIKAGIIGLTVTLALFSVPHLHFHDLALLLIPIYELVRLSRATGSLRSSAAVSLPIALSLLLLLINISPYLQYTIPYLIMVGLALYPFYEKLEFPVTKPHQS